MRLEIISELPTEKEHFFHTKGNVRPEQSVLLSKYPYDLILEHGMVQ